MKKSLATAALLTLIAVGGLAGCNQTALHESESKTFKITFVQQNRNVAVKEVKEGETLFDVPAPAPKTGYTVTWDKSDFANITENLTVNAIETANEYKIYYLLGDRDNAEIASREQTVRFDSSFTLYIPECDGYKFIKWVNTVSNTEIKDGTWSIADDVTLTAVWEIDDSDNGWTGFY